MTEKKRFHFGYVCGDTGLIDEQAELKWFIENCYSVKDLSDKLIELNEENEKLQASKEYWREKCLSKDSYNKLYHKTPIWFTQSIKLTDKQINKVAEAIEQDLKERRLKNE